MIKTFVTALALAAAAGLTGCWESGDVTLHEPGQYKGDKDPLLAQQASARGEALEKRFQIGQTDR